MNLFISDILFLIFFLVTLFLAARMRVWSKKNRNFPTPDPIRHPHYAILIPARDESAVIRGLLDSLQEQTYPILMEDVLIIVESATDPTVLIAKEYGTSIFVRKQLELKRKGYALNEGIQFLLGQQKQYDAYFILDADNVLDPEFFKEMTKTYQAGYEIGIGYRNTKNGNESVIAACSSLTFSMINTLGNDQKNKETRNMVVSGTGFYIKSNWVEKWGGYPFHSLTEDYELTLYATLHSIPTFYQQKAIFYDEQPIRYSVSATQRTRWIKGFLECRGKYGALLRKESKKEGKNAGSQAVEGMGILPVLTVVIGYAVSLLWLMGQMVVALFQHQAWVPYFLHLGINLMLLYLVLLIFTLLLLKKEGSKINLSRAMKWKVFFFHPIFLCSYVPCAVRALFCKNIGWQKIEHHTKKVT